MGGASGATCVDGQVGGATAVDWQVGGACSMGRIMVLVATIWAAPLVVWMGFQESSLVL